MNVANKLTILRVLLVPIFMAFLYIDFECNRLINNTSVALFVFIIASLTDLADGIIARRQGKVTDFGKFMDPLADKILTFAALLWFIEVGLMPVWIVLVVIIREFMVTGIRLVASVKGKVVAASFFGKVKTAVTLGCIVCIFLIYLFILTAQWLLIVCWTLIAVTTVVSGVEYYVKNKEIMKLEC